MTVYVFLLQESEEEAERYLRNLKSRYHPTLERWPSQFKTFATPYGNLIVDKIKNKLYAFPTCRRYYTIISRIYDDADVIPLLRDGPLEDQENDTFARLNVSKKLSSPRFQGVNCSKKFKINSPFDLMHLYEFIPENEFIQKQKHPISKNTFYVKMHFFSKTDFETRVTNELKKHDSSENLAQVEKRIRARLMIEDSEGTLRYRLCTFTSSPNQPHLGEFDGINLWSEIYPAHGILREALMRYKVIFCSN